MTMKMLTVLAAALVLSACGSDSSSPSSTSSTTIGGNWAGTVTSSGRLAQVGVGTLRTSIGQNGGALSGTWTVSYTNPANNNSGSLTGLVTGSSVTLTLTSSVPTACPFNVTATLSGSSSMSGTYATFNCTVADGGQFAATKQ
jgi:hypothetical protein